MPSELDDFMNEVLDTVPVHPAVQMFANSKRRPAIPIGDLITSYTDITPEHVDAIAKHIESGETLGVRAPSLKAIRHTHHRLAQLLAGGMDETRAGRLCNFDPTRVSVLKADPAFAELLAYYSEQVEDEFVEFVVAAKELSMDFLQHVQQQLDEAPEKFTPQLALEAIRTLADRSGNAPVSKSIAVNINQGMGDKLEAARQRAKAARENPPIKGTASVVN